MKPNLNVNHQNCLKITNRNYELELELEEKSVIEEIRNNKIEEYMCAAVHIIEKNREVRTTKNKLFHYRTIFKSTEDNKKRKRISRNKTAILTVMKDEDSQYSQIDDIPLLSVSTSHHQNSKSNPDISLEIREKVDLICPSIFVKTRATEHVLETLHLW